MSTSTAKREHPKFVYKHVSLEWVDANLNGSSIKFGSYEYYRTMEEELAPDEYSRIDRVEGVTLNRLHGELTSENRDQFDQMSNGGPPPFDIAPGFPVSFKNVLVSQPIAGGMIFCTSEHPNFGLCRRKGQVALEIDVALFFAGMFEDMRLDGAIGVGCGWVTYDKQEGDPLSGRVAYHNPYSKPPAFSFEEEFRFILETENLNDDVIFIQSAKMGRAMRRLETPAE
jgi:hypothetical protein